MWVFSCGEADNSSRGKLCSFFLISHKVEKKYKTFLTNKVAYVVVWDINFKSEDRSDLQGCLEAIVALKPHFLSLSPADGSS